MQHNWSTQDNCIIL